MEFIIECEDFKSLIVQVFLTLRTLFEMEYCECRDDLVKELKVLVDNNPSTMKVK